MDILLEGCRLTGLANPPVVSETRQADNALRSCVRIVDAVEPRKASKPFE